MRSTTKFHSAAVLVAFLAIGCGDDSTKETPIIIDLNNGTDAGTNNGSDADIKTDTGADGCTSNDDCASDPAGPVCIVASGLCSTPAAGALIGSGDGTASSVTFTEIFRPGDAIEAPDLAFHPTRNELWVLNRRFEVEGVCGSGGFNARCASLGGITTIIFNPGEANQRVQYLEDENSWHFMRRPPALAMGANDTFATCGEAFTGNYEDDPTMYIGPSLWSSDLSVYAQPSGGNGSHLDMLHETPWCMGIAHERDNVYWMFNGNAGSIDRVDFHGDHGPGADDHSDGEVHRYAKGSLLRVPGVPSHMIFDGVKDLYIVDTGNSRVVKLDTTSGTPGRQISPIYEQLAASGEMDNATMADVVAPGKLTAPSGIALHDGILYVSDNATSKFHAFDLEGNELRSLDTGLPPKSLAGFEVGPDGKIWFSEMLTGAVYRIDPK